MAKLPSLTIAYNKPSSLEFGATTPVTLVIASASVEDAKREVGNYPGGTTTAGGVHLAPDVEAYLTGPPDQVKITARGSPYQTLTEFANVQWTWDVEPLRPGETTLNLDIWTTVHLPGGDQHAKMKSYTDTIHVRANTIAGFAYELNQIDPIWKWVIAAIAGLGTAFGAWKWLRKGS